MQWCGVTTKAMRLPETKSQAVGGLCLHTARQLLLTVGYRHPSASLKHIRVFITIQSPAYTIYLIMTTLFLKLDVLHLERKRVQCTNLVWAAAIFTATTRVHLHHLNTLMQAQHGALTLVIVPPYTQGVNAILTGIERSSISAISTTAQVIRQSPSQLRLRQDSGAARDRVHKSSVCAGVPLPPTLLYQYYTSMHSLRSLNTSKASNGHQYHHTIHVCPYNKR